MPGSPRSRCSSLRDSQEAYDFVAEAFAISEEFDTPVLLRTSTKLSHVASRSSRANAVAPDTSSTTKDITKHLMVPQLGTIRMRFNIESGCSGCASAPKPARSIGLEMGTADFGIVSSGVVYQYANEAFPDAWFSSSASRTHCPIARSADLYEQRPEVFVVEELDPFFEDQSAALVIRVESAREAVPADGELDPDIVFAALEPADAEPPKRRDPVFPPAHASDLAAESVLPFRPPGAAPRVPAPLGLQQP